MKQKGKIQIGKMSFDAEIEMEYVNDVPHPSEGITDLIERILQQHIAEAAEVIFQDAMNAKPIIVGVPPVPANSPYAAFVEYGKPPEPANVVEGTIIKPITDEGRLLS